jgi:hypothetical protein
MATTQREPRAAHTYIGHVHVWSTTYVGDSCRKQLQLCHERQHTGLAPRAVAQAFKSYWELSVLLDKATLLLDARRVLAFLCFDSTVIRLTNWSVAPYLDLQVP